MRHLIGKQSSSHRQRKFGIYQRTNSVEELQFVSKGQKASGGDFCNASKGRRPSSSGGDFCNASKAQKMFKNLTELHQNFEGKKSAGKTNESYFRLNDGIGYSRMGLKRKNKATTSLVQNEFECDGIVGKTGPVYNRPVDSSEFYKQITQQLHEESNTKPPTPQIIEVEDKENILDQNNQNEWLQPMIDFAEQHEILVEFIICLPFLLMTLYILIVEQRSLFKYGS